MPSSFTVSEPHPTVSKGAYTHSGRGGAGNYFKAPETTPSEGVPTTVATTIPAAPRKFFTGRGGAGNIHSAAESVAPLMNFDEEFSRASHRDEGGVGHVGRGGAGNVYHNGAKSPAQNAPSSRRSSAESNSSTRSGFWARVSGASLHSHH